MIPKLSFFKKEKFMNRISYQFPSLNILKDNLEALQKPGFFKEFLGGQVFRGRKPIKRYTCSQANLSNNKITKKDSF
jgi:hypothetical protein